MRYYLEIGILGGSFLLVSFLFSSGYRGWAFVVGLLFTVWYYWNESDKEEDHG